MTRTTFRNLADKGEFIRLIGVHDGLSAILAERSGFEGLWVSGLAVSSSHGVPDAGLLTMTEYHAAAVQIRRATQLPIVADVDGGYGDANVIRRMVGLYEDAGIDAVCIEDKQYPKRNSFWEGNRLEEPAVFAHKIAVAKAAQRTDDFMVVARVESLTSGADMDDAVLRAHLYADAGADAVLIHSKRHDDTEIEEFARRWRADGSRRPVIAIPTTYYRTPGAQLAGFGITAAVYANQLIRASVAAMQDLLDSVQRNGSTSEYEERIVSMPLLFGLTGAGLTLGDEAGAPAAGRG